MDRTTGVIAAIPARYGSVRFPGKPLAPLAGEPMIAHVVRRATEAPSISSVVVATDDDRIAEAAWAAGANVVLTGECASGTDRVAEAMLPIPGWELVVNLQGDEPLLAADNIEALVAAMRAEPEIGMATLCRPLPEDRRDDPNAVKVVRAVNRHALYFSRSLVPFPRDAKAAARLWRLHLGIYGYRRDTLARFVTTAPAELEGAEGLEQLRALAHGIDILVVDAPADSFGVDTPADLERAEARLAAGHQSR